MAASGTRTGKEFEREVFEAIQRVLASGELLLNPNTAKVYHQKAYYSRDRGKDIVVDVSIEATLLGASTSSIIWVWECKDYNSPIPVDDVEEFHAKLQQIGADRTKGTLIARGGYQESALNYAQAKGIGLARLMPESQVEWVIYRSKAQARLRSSAISETERALVEPAFCTRNQDFFGFTGQGRTRSGLTLASFIELSLDEWGIGRHQHSQR
jgi:hypothetical protein